MSKRRVVITGIGVVCPVGNTVEEFWSNLIAGKSGAAPITYFDTTHFDTKFACEVKGFDPLNYMDRKLSQRRIYPAIDVKASSTRNEEILLGKDVLNQAWRVRRMLDVMKEEDATTLLIERLKKTKSNKEFLATLHEDI